MFSEYSFFFHLLPGAVVAVIAPQGR